MPNYSELHLNVQPHSVYINEPGLYELVTKSTKQIAIDFRTWLFNDVLPEIHKYGKYELSKKHQIEMEKTRKEMYALKQNVKNMKHNAKKIKYPKGGAIYIIRPLAGDPAFLKIGKTRDLEKRIRTYNTGVPDNMKLLYFLYVDDPDGVETCLKTMLKKYQYRENKEYYKCKKKIVVDAILKCDNFTRGEFYCDKCTNLVDRCELSRHLDANHNHTFLDLGAEEEIEFRIYTEIADEQKYHDHDSDVEQMGGNNKGSHQDYEYKYKKYKHKYLKYVLKKQTR
ncbi:MAG: BRO-N domain protein [Hyperionvirus sp.]|uniref:BRO-N domain protein n=1 Tax=Hyperionvirus sp. TaxID=2487770 RepID=A0A3G5ACN4_9VIRU|nr:MAG: BRO-N domain protein [Hyperionvirus sp.]